MHTLDARLEGLLAGGDAVPDLDDEEIDPVGRVAFYPARRGAGRPGPPTVPHATARGGRVSLDWGPPLAGAEPAFYVLDAGSTPGGRNIASGTPIGADTSLDVNGVPPGQVLPPAAQRLGRRGQRAIRRAVARRRARSAAAARPEPPADLAVSVSGLTVLLAWGESPTPGVTGYRVMAGPWPAATGFATTVPATTTSLAVPAPAGVFVVRVDGHRRLRRAACRRILVVLGVGGALMPPGEPLDFIAEVTGNTVAFSWAAPVTGGAAAGYVLEAGSGPGLSRPRARALRRHIGECGRGAPPGTYFVRVRAVNAAGAGAASGEVQVVGP